MSPLETAASYDALLRGDLDLAVTSPTHRPASSPGPCLYTCRLDAGHVADLAGPADQVR